MKKIILLTSVIFCCIQVTMAQPGKLDSLFGNNGNVIANLGKDYIYPDHVPATEVLVQSDGSMYVLHGPITKRGSGGSIDSSFALNGSTSDGFFAQTAVIQPDGKIIALGNNSLARYNINGSRDSTFSIDANQIIGIYMSSIAIQTDGKVVAAGYNFNGSNKDFAVIRFDFDGSLDKTFDQDGKQNTDFNSSDDAATSIAIQKDGKIVVAGNTNNLKPDFAVARYKVDGSLDNTFSGDGIQTTDFTGSQDFVTTVAIQPDEKIVLAGYSNFGPFFGYTNFALARYNANGSLDKTFSEDGKQTTDLDSNNLIDSRNYIRSASIQSDGKIVVAGVYTSGYNFYFTVARYNVNGSLDESFSDDGNQSTNFGAKTGGNAYSVAIQSDGKIVAAGESSSSYMALARYNQDGTPDNSFDRDGWLIDGFHARSTVLKGAAIQKDRKIVAAGTTYNGRNFDFALVRYNIDGSLDSSFNKNGTQLTDFDSKDDYASSIAIQSDGKIVVSGYSGNNDSSDINIARYNYNISVALYNTDGSLDSSFSVDGKQTTDFDSNPNEPNSVAIQSDGKIVIVGNASSHEDMYLVSYYTSFIILRYNADGSLDDTFSEHGKQRIHFFEPPNDSENELLGAYGSSVAIQSDGKIVASGFVPYDNGSLFALVHLNADGSLQWKRYVIGEASGECSIALQNDEKILMAGRSDYRGYSRIEVFRFNTDGSNDNSFLGQAYGGEDHHEQVNSMAIQKNGKILLGGFGFFRYNTNGKLDTTFGNNGTGYTDGNADKIIISDDKLYTITGAYLSRYLIDDKSKSSPVVMVTAPSNDTTYIALARIKIHATASDADGSISKVEFYNGTILLHTETEAPYDCIIDSAGVGSYTITAKAYDNDDNVTTSATVNITVVANIAPTVSMKTPADHESFTAFSNIILSANADDVDGRITKLEFYNGSTLLFTETAAPYYRKWFHVPVGNYSITARATDNKGAVTTSSPVNISVVPDIAPLVSITSPANGAGFTAPAAIELSADASDIDGTIRTVDFYNGNTLLFTERYLPYSKTWLNVPECNYSITAVATDNNGRTTTSAPVAISVGAVPAPMARGDKLNLSNKPFSLNVNPNPVAKTLNISIDGLQTKNKSAMFLLSASGAVIKTIQSSVLNKNIQLDVSSLSAGVYFIKVINGDKTLYKRFVKL